MSLLARSLSYAQSHSDTLFQAFVQHLQLVAVPLGMGLLLGLPLGFFSSRSQMLSLVVINAFSSLRVIPSLAILFLAIPYFGLSFRSAVVALTLLALPPILISTDVAFRSLEPALREAALSMGMTPGQVLRHVEIPLALPVILAGVKTATIEVIASATLAAFIGAGGLGTFITLGFALYDNAILLVGAIPVALLAIAAEIGLGTLQRALEPPQA
jgi:osmoprotectant transport system permease protein